MIKFTDMKIPSIQLKDNQKLFLVFEGDFHHGIYFDLQLCIAHYSSLVDLRSPGSHFDVYELIYDSDLSCFVPNGIVCRIHQNNKIVCRYKSDFEIISRFSSLYKVILDYPMIKLNGRDELPY